MDIGKLGRSKILSVAKSWRKWSVPAGEGRRSEISVDHVGDGFVSGWAWRPKSPRQRLRLSFFIDGKVVGEATADTLRQDLVDAGKGDGAHGFHLELPGDLTKSQLKSLAIRSIDDGTVLFGNLPDKRPGRASGRSPKIEFGLDVVSNSEIRGWAIDPLAPGRRLRIDLVENDEVIAHAISDQFRRDLAEAGKSNGACAFFIPVPARVRTGRVHDLFLSCASAGGAFVDIGERTFADVRVDLSSFSLTGIDGTAWVDGGVAAKLPVSIALNGETVCTFETDGDGAFQQALPVAAIWSAIGSSRSGLQADVELELFIGGQSIALAQLEFEVSSSRQFAVHFDRLDRSMVSGVIVWNSAESSVPTLSIGGMEIIVARASGLAPFNERLACLNLQDGTVSIEITGGAAGGEVVSRELDYRRAEVELDVKDGIILGTVRYNREIEGEVSAELLIDGVPVSVVPIKPLAASVQDVAELDSRVVHGFELPLSARWLDGAAHQVRFRFLGTEELLPERPVLFKAGTPQTQVNCFVEALPSGRIEGWAVAPWAPEQVATVTILRDGKTIASREANSPHPMLASNGLICAERGFGFDLPSEKPGPVTVRIGFGEDVSISYTIDLLHDEVPYRLGDAGSGRDGICFVLPDPGVNARAREEARSLLFLAAKAAEKAKSALTIAFTREMGGVAAPGADLSALIRDLVGSRAAEAIVGAAWVVVPRAPLPSTAYDASLRAYELDIWVRANRFSAIVGSSREGCLAYCCDSRRQGLIESSPEISILLENFCIGDILSNDHLLDQPQAIFDEALEKRALMGAQHILAPNRQLAAFATEVARSIEDKLTFIEAPSEFAPPVALMPGEELEGRWLVWAAPLRTRNGLRLFCDALDRVVRRKMVSADAFNIAFVGPEDLLRQAEAVAYIRNRARNWPFSIRLHPNLAWDGYRRVISRFGAGAEGYYLKLPQLAGTAWDEICRQAGLIPIEDGSLIENNPTALAELLERLASGQFEPAPSVGAAVRASPLNFETPAGRAEALQDSAVSPPPLVSVCISHFNRPTLLRQAIASVEGCGYPNLEIIVVDDGSAVVGVAEELAQIEAELRTRNGKIVFQANRYLGAARNQAARHAKGDLIIFMDDDNIAHPDMISEFLRVQGRTGAAIVTSRFALFDAADDIDPLRDVPRMIGVPLGPDAAGGLLSNCFGDANMLITREAYEQLGGFTEDFGRGHEDWELYSKAISQGLPQEVICRPLFWYREAATSMLRGRESVEFDLLRNVRGYQSSMPHGAYRIVQLAQGLLQRWGTESLPVSRRAATGLQPGNRLAFGRAAVIMRTKDRPLLLGRAIDSVINQTYPDWTLVIVNDGGDPKPVEKLIESRRHALNGRHLLINNPKSTGMENASNAGLTYSASEFVTIHDDDDAWDPNFLEKTISYLDFADPSVGGVVTHATVVIEEMKDGRVMERDRFPFKKMEAIELSRLAYENQFPPISFLFRRSIMEVIGQFDGELPVLGDWDFHLRVAERFHIEVLTEPLAYYHHRVEGTDTRYGNTVVAQREIHKILRAKFLNKHMRSALHEGGMSNGDMLFLGDIGKRLEEKMVDCKEHIGWIENLLNDQRKHTRYLEEMIERIPGYGRKK